MKSVWWASKQHLHSSLHLSCQVCCIISSVATATSCDAFIQLISLLSKMADSSDKSCIHDAATSVCCSAYLQSLCFLSPSLSAGPHARHLNHMCLVKLSLSASNAVSGFGNKPLISLLVCAGVQVCSRICHLQLSSAPSLCLCSLLMLGSALLRKAVMEVVLLLLAAKQAQHLQPLPTIYHWCLLLPFVMAVTTN